MTAPEPSLAPPPLPELFDAERSQASVANGWRQLVESVPVFAEKLRMVATKQFPVCARSPFRTGTIRFTDDGVEMVGMAKQLPPNWYRWLALAGAFPWVFVQLTTTGGRLLKLSFGVRMMFLLVAGLVGVILQYAHNRVEKRRAETKLLLGWESVRGVLADATLQSVTLIYTPITVNAKLRVFALFRRPNTPPVAEIAALSHEFLTLGRLEPPVVAGVVDTVTYFAPHAHRETIGKVNPVVHWLTIVLIAVAAMGLVAAVSFLYIQYRRLTRP